MAVTLIAFFFITTLLKCSNLFKIENYWIISDAKIPSLLTNNENDDQVTTTTNKF